jgi:hypothetical protein
VVQTVFDSEYLSQINITFSNQSYLVFDNLDIRRVQAPKSNPDAGALIEIFNSHHVTMTNLYLHGWRLEGTGPRPDGAHGGLRFGIIRITMRLPTHQQRFCRTRSSKTPRTPAVIPNPDKPLDSSAS